jgi:hypothetical protein
MDLTLPQDSDSESDEPQDAPSRAMPSKKTNQSPCNRLRRHNKTLSLRQRKQQQPRKKGKHQG